MRTLLILVIMKTVTRTTIECKTMPIAEHYKVPTMSTHTHTHTHIHTHTHTHTHTQTHTHKHTHTRTHTHQK